MVAAGVMVLDRLEERDELWSCAGGFVWKYLGLPLLCWMLAVIAEADEENKDDDRRKSMTTSSGDFCLRASVIRCFKKFENHIHKF
jgi:hypothetical protein